MTTTSVQDRTRTPSAPGRAARRTALAGAAYVASWLAGLAVAPPAPQPDAASSEVAAFYAEHGLWTRLR